MRPSPFLNATVGSGSWPQAPDPLRPLRRLTAALTVAVLVLALLALRLDPDGKLSPRRLLVHHLNLAIAWADLNLGLGSEASGAARAVAADPEQTNAIGRQGAHWLALQGSPGQRLSWSRRLRRSDPHRPGLLQAAVIAAFCKGAPQLRKEAAKVAHAERLTLPRTRRNGRQAC